MIIGGLPPILPRYTAYHRYRGLPRPIRPLRAVCLAKKALVAGFTFRLLLRPQSHKYKPTAPAYGKTIETSQDQNISHSQQKQKQLRKQSTILKTGSTLGKGKKKDRNERERKLHAKRRFRLRLRVCTGLSQPTHCSSISQCFLSSQEPLNR